MDTLQWAVSFFLSVPHSPYGELETLRGRGGVLQGHSWGGGGVNCVGAFHLLVNSEGESVLKL